ncbi:MAG TPA: hypothetical protein VLC09_09515, partial [Polyangiaceae bacterium]|nr:hypothetical protein [Polyangiaceae bacterium]
PHVPAGIVALLSDLGVLVLRADAAALRQLDEARDIGVPAPSSWTNGRVPLETETTSRVEVEWLAQGSERRSFGPVDAIAGDPLTNGGARLGAAAGALGVGSSANASLPAAGPSG